MWSTTRALVYLVCGVVFLAIAAAFGVVNTGLVVLAPLAIALIGLMFSVIGLSFTAVIPEIDYLTYYWTLFLTPCSSSRASSSRSTGRHTGSALRPGSPLAQAVRLMRALTLT